MISCGPVESPRQLVGLRCDDVTPSDSSPAPQMMPQGSWAGSSPDLPHALCWPAPFLAFHKDLHRMYGLGLCQNIGLSTLHAPFSSSFLSLISPHPNLYSSSCSPCSRLPYRPSTSTCSLLLSCSCPILCPLLLCFCPHAPFDLAKRLSSCALNSALDARTIWTNRKSSIMFQSVFEDVRQSWTLFCVRRNTVTHCSVRAITASTLLSRWQSLNLVCIALTCSVPAIMVSTLLSQRQSLITHYKKDPHNPKFPPSHLYHNRKSGAMFEVMDPQCQILKLYHKVWKFGGRSSRRYNVIITYSSSQKACSWELLGLFFFFGPQTVSTPQPVLQQIQEWQKILEATGALKQAQMLGCAMGDYSHAPKIPNKESAIVWLIFWGCITNVVCLIYSRLKISRFSSWKKRLFEVHPNVRKTEPVKIFSLRPETNLNHTDHLCHYYLRVIQISFQSLCLPYSSSSHWLVLEPSLLNCLSTLSSFPPFSLCLGKIHKNLHPEEASASQPFSIILSTKSLLFKFHYSPMLRLFILEKNSRTALFNKSTCVLLYSSTIYIKPFILLTLLLIGCSLELLRFTYPNRFSCSYFFPFCQILSITLQAQMSCGQPKLLRGDLVGLNFKVRQLNRSERERVYKNSRTYTIPNLMSKHASQAPFCCGIAQVLVWPDHWYTQPTHMSFSSCFLSLTLANQLTFQANILKSSVSHYISLFPDCIIWFQRLPHLCLLFFIFRNYIPLAKRFPKFSFGYFYYKRKHQKMHKKTGVFKCPGINRG
ncbi:hypothetical protein VP01_951g4 [Puccinia sorghi]|uniref:Uncharacterized protein n=1 Tax=Puccinia sorghi TaxID=27349 RepID=A0A0L6U6C7_9BASI|nr:hypothetical protein VP01_951g4 [Puccinia sorghi]